MRRSLAIWTKAFCFLPAPPLKKPLRVNLGCLGGFMFKRYFRQALGLNLVILTLVRPGLSQAGPSPSGTKWAVVNGETITEDQVKKAAAEDLENLQLRKMQAEAGFQRDEHSIYERTLTNIVDDKLLAAEAKKRGISVEDMLRAE